MSTVAFSARNSELSVDMCDGRYEDQWVVNARVRGIARRVGTCSCLRTRLSTVHPRVITDLFPMITAEVPNVDILRSLRIINESSTIPSFH